MTGCTSSERVVYVRPDYDFTEAFSLAPTEEELLLLKYPVSSWEDSETNSTIFFTLYEQWRDYSENMLIPLLEKVSTSK